MAQAQDLEDLIADALQDSFDVDWNSRVGAKAVVAALAQEAVRSMLSASVQTLAGKGTE